MEQKLKLNNNRCCIEISNAAILNDTQVKIEQ